MPKSERNRSLTSLLAPSITLVQYSQTDVHYESCTSIHSFAVFSQRMLCSWKIIVVFTSVFLGSIDTFSCAKDGRSKSRNEFQEKLMHFFFAHDTTVINDVWYISMRLKPKSKSFPIISICLKVFLFEGQDAFWLLGGWVETSPTFAGANVH
jgi:hypothetical protein